jgi:hypothetical protein
MSANARFAVGVAMLVVGAILPLCVFPVAHSSWPAAVKTAVGGVLFFGFEIMAIPAAAVMGKENFERIVKRAKGWVGSLKPAGDIGPVRHWTGLILFLLPVAPGYVMAYAPQWLPDATPARLWVNLAADAMFLTSLFVLGGDFWDKLRALFVRQARAAFPPVSGKAS